METPWYQKWGNWRRVLLIAAGILGLVPQFFVLADQPARWIAFGIAVCNLLIGFLPDKAVARVTGLEVK